MRYTKTIFIILCVIYPTVSSGHHVLGRPSYNISENSTTPPSVQMEAQLGEMSVTFMTFPAFPKPNEESRLNLYITSMKDGSTYSGEVEFSVRDDSWISSQIETIGRQKLDDNVFRQGVIFKENGDYLVRASFQHNNEPYTIDFPLRVGPNPVIGPIGLTVATIVLILLSVNFIQRKKLQRLKILSQHNQTVGNN